MDPATGITGHSILNAGQIHAPYIPMQTTPSLLKTEPSIVDHVAALDEENGAAARKRIADWEKDKATWNELRSRIRKRGVVIPRPDFFAKVDVTNL
jgi:hypothetical protein